MNLLTIDKTASLAANYITDYYVADTSKVDVILPYYGWFYKNDIEIYTMSGDTLLEPLILNTDYKVVGYDASKSRDAQYPLFTGIIINQTQYPRYKLRIKCRYYGGELAANKAVIRDTLGNISTSNLDYANITNLPTEFPYVNTQDFASYLVKWDSVNQAITQGIGSMTRVMAQKASYNATNTQIALTNLIDKLSNAINTITSLLPGSIAQHITGTGYKHVLSADMLGLGNVANLGFASTYSDTNTNVYISPKVLKDAIANHDPLVVLTHTGHGETAAQVGLGKISNLSFLNSYTEGDFNGFSSFKAYLSNYVANLASVDSMLTDYHNGFYTSMSSFVGAVKTEIDAVTEAITQMTTQANAILEISPIINTLLTQLNTVLMALVTRYRQKYYNIVYADALSQIIDIEYTALANSSNVFANGVYPAPKELPNLVLWLSPALSSMKTVNIDDKARVKQISDMSLNANHAIGIDGLYPYLQASSDYNNGNLELRQNVIRFKANQYMKLTRPLILPGDFTIIVLYRNTSRTNVSLLKGNNYVISSDANNAININGKYILPELSAVANSELIIMNISKKHMPRLSWGTSSNGTRFTTNLLGLSSVPVTDQDVVRIDYLGHHGISDLTADSEFAELMIYDRILSLPEITAIQNYLSYQHSLKLALTLNYPNI